MSLGCSLAACGGGGGGTPTTSTKADTPRLSCAELIAIGSPVPPACHINAYWGGDSKDFGANIDNTSNVVQYPGVGNGIAGRASSTPAQLQQAWLDKTFGAGVVTIIDDGSIPGSTLLSDLNGTPPSVSPLATRLASLPKHVGLVFTDSLTNDLYSGQTVAEYKANLTDWINVVVQYGAKPIFLEPSPICSPRAPYTTFADQIAATNQFAATADTVFQNAGFPALGNMSVFENYTTPPNPQPWNVALMSSDCVHENQAGYTFDANNYFNGAPNMVGTTNSLKAIITNMLQSITP